MLRHTVMYRLRALASDNRLWVILLIGCALCATRNWQAALMFALAIGVGQATTRLELSQYHLLGGYTFLAVVACFFIDRYSGVVLAVIGVVIGAHLLGLIDNKVKIIAGEILLIAGLLTCGFNGPSGGYYSRSALVYPSGSGAVDLVRSRFVSKASPPSKENL